MVRSLADLVVLVGHDPGVPANRAGDPDGVAVHHDRTGDDRPGQWGWGTPFVGYFDPKKVNVVNRAVGGTTSASFYNAQWKAMVDLTNGSKTVDQVLADLDKEQQDAYATS